VPEAAVLLGRLRIGGLLRLPLVWTARSAPPRVVAIVASSWSDTTSGKRQKQTSPIALAVEATRQSHSPLLKGGSGMPISGFPGPYAIPKSGGRRLQLFRSISMGVQSSQQSMQENSGVPKLSCRPREPVAAFYLIHPSSRAFVFAACQACASSS